jgi:vacuolar-type H+-ATPase subunit I/STV1
MKLEAGFSNSEVSSNLSEEEKARLEAMRQSQGENSTEENADKAAETLDQTKPIEPEEIKEPERIEEITKPESIDDAETLVNPDELLKNADASLAETQEQIKQLTASLEARKGELGKIRKSLGMEETPAEQLPEEKQLEQLKAKEENLEEQKKEAEMTKDLEEVLERLAKLPKPELIIIIQTGKGTDGKELESKHGKIDPKVAKELGKAAEKGETKLTKGLLKMLVGLMGVISAIFEMIVGAAGKAAE